MVRSVVADKFLESDVRNLLNSGVQYGLIVGQNTPGRTVVAHLTRTPLEPADTASSTPASGINDSWITKHAKQLVRLLPGGLDILGVFIVAGSDVLKTSENQLRSSLTAIYRALAKLPHVHREMEEDKLVAAVDPRTGKITCRSVELQNLTASFRPADWRYQELRWHRVQSELFLDVTSAVSPLALETSMFRQIMGSLEPYLAVLSEAVCLVDGQMAPPDRPLNVSEDKSNRNVGGTFTMDLLYDPMKEKLPEKDASEPVEAVIRITGRMHCLAFLHTKATVSEALSALVSDIRRSLYARCQMHCDSLVEEQSAEERSAVLHEPPHRVLAPLTGPASTLHVSDYLFPGDTAADSLQTFRELLGLTLQTEQVLDNVETPTEDVAHSECSSEAETVENLHELQTAAETRCSVLHVLLAAVIVVIGVLISSLALLGPKPPSTRQH